MVRRMKSSNVSGSKYRLSCKPDGESASGVTWGDALDRMLARLTTQRACLDFAAVQIATLPGPILELGLGKGRTYDRIRRTMPDRVVLAFDNDIHCPITLRPPSDNLFLGDFRDTLPAALDRLGRTAAMVHADIGSEDRERDTHLAADIAPLIAPLVIDNGVVLSDRHLPLGPRWQSLELPRDAKQARWPYFIWARLR